MDHGLHQLFPCQRKLGNHPPFWSQGISSTPQQTYNGKYTSGLVASTCGQSRSTGKTSIIIFVLITGLLPISNEKYDDIQAPKEFDEKRLSNKKNEIKSVPKKKK